MERMEAVMQREGVGRVNLPGAIKKCMKGNFPAFPFDHSASDLHRFTNRVSDDLQLYVEFERIHHHGLGKTFTIYLGVVYRDVRNAFRENLMSFFDRSPMNWVYGASEDLDACLGEATTLLALALPAFQAVWANEYRRELPVARPLTFHGAAEYAYRQFQDFYPQFSTIGDCSWNVHAMGRPAGTWTLGFYDNNTDRCLHVKVLSSGVTLYALGNQGYIKRGDTLHHALPRRYANEHFALPVQPTASAIIRSRPWEAFLDSPGVFEIAAANGGAAFTSRHTSLALALYFHFQRSDPPSQNEEWRVFYRDGGPDRRYLNLHLSARTGEVLNIAQN